MTVAKQMALVRELCRSPVLVEFVCLRALAVMTGNVMERFAIKVPAMQIMSVTTLLMIPSFRPVALSALVKNVVLWVPFLQAALWEVSVASPIIHSILAWILHDVWSLPKAASFQKKEMGRPARYRKSISREPVKKALVLVGILHVRMAAAEYVMSRKVHTILQQPHVNTR